MLCVSSGSSSSGTSSGDVVQFSIDGPPFCTGSYHIGHIMVSTFKSILAKWFGVTEQAGWDCHGVPIESFVRKNIGNVKYDTSTFNKECSKVVMQCKDEWQGMFDKLGREITNVYQTNSFNYMSAVIQIFNTLYHTGYVYKAKSIQHYSLGLKSVLSKQESKK